MAKDKERIVEVSKVNEENLGLAGGKCWRRKCQSALCFTGEISNRFPRKVMFATIQVVSWGISIEIYLRELDLAFRRAFCYGGLRSPRHCLLQH